jgi:membrane carboxypeptidase/penicillin-binding protein
MGYPGGEIPMLSVHGLAVAGATFPVPIWHAFMTVAEAGKPARDFLVPAQPPTYRPFVRGNFGFSALPPTTTTTTTTAAVLPAAPPKFKAPP